MASTSYLSRYLHQLSKMESSPCLPLNVAEQSESQTLPALWLGDRFTLQLIICSSAPADGTLTSTHTQHHKHWDRYGFRSHTELEMMEFWESQCQSTKDTFFEASLMVFLLNFWSCLARGQILSNNFLIVSKGCNILLIVYLFIFQIYFCSSLFLVWQLEQSNGQFILNHKNSICYLNV